MGPPLRRLTSALPSALLLAVCAASAARADGTPPALAFTTLTEGATVTGTVNVGLQAADGDGVVRLVLAIDGTVVADLPDTTSISYAWNTSGLPEVSDHTLVADAFDGDGNHATRSITVSIRDVSGPAITWLAPDGSTVTADSVAVSFGAADVSGIRHLVLSIDGAIVAAEDTGSTLTYAWNVVANANGTLHTLTADAYDSIGHRTTTSRDVTIADVAKPSVTFVRPDHLQVFGLERVEVHAADNKGVARLTLKVDGTTVHEEVGVSSFTYLWDAAQAGVGSHPVLTAIAADTAGNQASASLATTVIPEDHPSHGAVLGMAPSAPYSGGIPESVSFADARNQGARVLYWYLRWSEVAANPNANAVLMQQLAFGGVTAINFDVVHSTVLSTYPPPYQSFTDPGFADAFSDFAADFAATYHPAYLFVGNEANIYLENHLDEVDAYGLVIRRTREKIHAASPSTQVGVVLHYSGFPTDTRLQIISELAAEADMVGYTVYGARVENGATLFDDPANGMQLLDDLPGLAPGKPFAVVETGWNTSSRFDSNETLQTSFLRLLRHYVETSRAQFVSLFLYQDGVDCTQQALSFAEPGTNPDPQSPEVQDFAEYLCRFGLRRANGTPKEAWNYLGETTWPSPEPAAFASALAALGGLCWLRRSRRRARGEVG
jgi:hypothetical protein